MTKKTLKLNAELFSRYFKALSQSKIEESYQSSDEL